MTQSTARYPSLQGKVACITGAGRARGIGATIARRLAAEGASVVLTDIGKPAGPDLPESFIGTTAELDRITAQIETDGGQARATSCDVQREADVAACVAHCVEQFGRLDIWVNNAGVGYLMEPLTDLSADQWDTVLGVNLRGAWLGTKHAAQQMIKQGEGGRIINIASQAAKSGFPFAAAYCASKHGLIGLTRVSAIELGQHNITANAICPNHITTGLGAWQNEYFSKATGRSLDQYMADMRSRIPIGRPGLTDDIAKACAWLCSDEAAYVTGEAMNVSGGEEMH
ncbi:MAG: SDR family NAD(P)-dependent oxidoreductase [Pseudomonadota bacterium]